MMPYSLNAIEELGRAIAKVQRKRLAQRARIGERFVIPKEEFPSGTGKVIDAGEGWCLVEDDPEGAATLARGEIPDDLPPRPGWVRGDNPL